MRQKIRPLWLAAGLLVAAPASHGLDTHLQELPPAPGLVPSEALDPLEGVREAVNCGLDFLATAKNCGLGAPEALASPFAVTFDPLFCRPTMRFTIGRLIDELLNQWIAGALARLDSPAIGALCLLGIGPQYCGATETAPPMRSPVPRRTPPRKSAASPGATPGQQRALREALKAATGERDIPAVPTREAVPAPAPPSPTPNGAQDDEPTGLDHLLR